MAKFSKYSGCGNDFILFHDPIPGFTPDLIQKLCHRQFGIGADGIILHEGEQSPFRMRIFNSDGSEAEMCGNGIRCLANYLHSHFPQLQNFQIDVMDSSYSIQIETEGMVKVSMRAAKDIQFDQTISIEDKNISYHFLDTGVPHAVIFGDNFDLMKIGPKIRYHERFKPKGTNVDLALLQEDGKVSFRTYERGVEGETLACGTGAVAVALAAAHVYGLKSPVVTITASGDELLIGFDGNQVTMTGPAKKIFEGEIHLR